MSSPNPIWQKIRLFFLSSNLVQTTLSIISGIKAVGFSPLARVLTISTRPMIETIKFFCRNWLCVWNVASTTGAAHPNRPRESILWINEPSTIQTKSLSVNLLHIKWNGSLRLGSNCAVLESVNARSRFIHLPISRHSLWKKFCKSNIQFNSALVFLVIKLNNYLSPK